MIGEGNLTSAGGKKLRRAIDTKEPAASRYDFNPGR